VRLEVNLLNNIDYIILDFAYLPLLLAHFEQSQLA